jgi:hypothetical protein
MAQAGGYSGSVSPQHMAEMFQLQASACHALGSPFYGVLLQRLAKDILADGPTAAVLAGHEDDPGESALALRLMGAVHYMALTGDAPDVAAHFPSTGGDGDPAQAWPAIVDLMRGAPLELAAGLRHAPQTNEVGRAAALFGALLAVGGPDPLPVRLFEIGASAGLNLRADRFCYRSADGHRYGPLSPVTLDPAFMTLPTPAPGLVHVVERRGSDTAPIDPLTREGAARLASFVWPDQHERMQRLRSAILVAGQYPAEIETCGAADLVDRIEPADGHLTVLWHSVTLQYLDAAEKLRIAHRLNTIGAQASDIAPFAHLSFEPRRLSAQGVRRYLVTAETWPGGGSRAGDHHILGEAPAHGIPVTWGEPVPDAARPAPDGPQWPI